MTIDTRGLNHSDSMQLVHSLLLARRMDGSTIKILVELNEKKEFMRHVFEILTASRAVIEDTGDYAVIRIGTHLI